jgi:hypothetical protein
MAAYNHNEEHVMMKPTTGKLIAAALASILASAAFADTGEVTGHASADSRANACNTAVFAAKQDMPPRAQAVRSNCECDQQRNAMGRIDCYATVTWRTKD